MSIYTITICLNNETLRGGRSIDDGFLDDACVEACDAARRVYFDWEVDNDDDFYPDTTELKTNGTFADWNGGRMNDTFCDHVVVTCDEPDAEVPKVVWDISTQMDKAISDALDDHADEFTMPAEPVVEQTYRQPSKPGHAHIVEITLADGVDVAYVTMNCKTYYLDDTTDEGICECND